MIRFIDITTGNVFNGSKPYVFWFDKEQSVNLNYIRKICVLSTSENMQITLPTQEVFHLLDTEKMGEDIEMSGKLFKDLGADGFKTYSYTSSGTAYNGMYVHMLYIHGMSTAAGEYRETLTIGGEEFTIGADFYNEQENLAINLINQGVEIPKAVEKAIYDFNVHEESNDNILLNRKYKELLGEFMNVVGNKGSYKSLINSLNWFEYGDLLKIYEYWKHEEPTRTILDGKNLEQLVTTEIQDILTKSHKTTYIGIYFALTKVALNADGEIEYIDKDEYWDEEASKKYGVNWESAYTQKLIYDSYENPTDRLLQVGEENVNITEYPDGFEPASFGHTGSNWMTNDQYFDEEGEVVIRTIPEPVPGLTMGTSQWDAIDLSLKLTLLGNFFSTYFMPLHLDLIHSTVESISFNTIKLLSWSNLSRQDYSHDLNSFVCGIDGEKFYMTDVKARVYPDTTFGSQYDTKDGYLKIYGESDVLDTIYNAATALHKVLKRNSNNVELTDVKESYVNSFRAYYEGSPVREEFFNGQPTIMGVELEDRNYLFNDNTVKTFLSQRFEGPGCIIPVECVFRELSSDIEFVEGQLLVSSAENECQVFTTYNIYKTKLDEDRWSVKFNLLVTQVGRFHMVIDLKYGTGDHYMQSVDFVVGDDTAQQVDLYRVIKRDRKDISERVPKDLKKNELISWMFTQLDHTPAIYKQYLTTSTEDLKDKIGLNDVITYEPQVDASGTATYYMNIDGVACNDLSTILDTFQEKYPSYTVIELNKLYINSKLICETYPMVEEVVKYKNSKNLGYLYTWIQKQENPEQYYLVIPYFTAINNEFSTNQYICLGKEKKCGIIKENQEYINGFSYINVDCDTLFLDYDPLKSDSEYNILYKSYDKGDGFVFRKLTKEPFNHVINNKITFRFEFPNNLYKDMIIEVGRSQRCNDSYVIVDGEEYTIRIPGLVSKKPSITNITGTVRTGKLYRKDMFISCFHKLERLTDRIIRKGDVVCFLPSLTMTKKGVVRDLGWTFKNATTHEDIKPIPYREDGKVSPVQPLLGHYDVDSIPESGYYDVELVWEMVDAADHKHLYRSRSEFIIEK